MKNLIAILLTATIFFGCSKSDKTTGSDPDPEKNEEIEVAYEGYLESDGGGYDVEGTFKISLNGEFAMDDMAGSMKGTATFEKSAKYTINIHEAEGSYEHLSTIAGDYDLGSKELTLNAKDVNNNSVSLIADGITIEEHNQQWVDSRLSSAVYFTHNIPCEEATITIDGNTLWGGSINAHWEEEGYCSTNYDIWREISEDFDDKGSRVFCSKGTLMGLDGEPVEFEDCYTARAVLDKNTNYSYTVAWSNGSTTSGNFTTPDGGGRKAVCLENDGIVCIRITDISLEIDQSKSDLDYIYPNGGGEFNFDVSEYSVRVGNAVWVGHAAESPFSFIRFFDATGLKQKTYNLDTEDIELSVVISGRRDYVFTNVFMLLPNIHNSDSKGTVTITNLDYNSNELTIVFDDVIVGFRIILGGSTIVDHIRYSGTVTGNFYNFQ